MGNIGRSVGIIEGIPHAMGPLPVPRHQQIATSMAAEFHFQLKKCKNCITYQPLDYRVADYLNDSQATIDFTEI